jgi:hypothetical protein
MPMRKSQVDFENRLVHIPDSKTPNGEGDMPMTAAALRAFQAQCEATPGSEYEEGLGVDVAEGPRAVPSTVRIAAHVTQMLRQGDGLATRQSLNVCR